MVTNLISITEVGCMTVEPVFASLVEDPLILCYGHMNGQTNANYYNDNNNIFKVVQLCHLTFKHEKQSSHTIFKVSP